MATPDDKKPEAGTPPQKSQDLNAMVKAAVEEARKTGDIPEQKWAISNLVFLVFSLFVGGLIGYFFDYLKSQVGEENYSLQIAQQVGSNLIEWPELARNKVVVTYKDNKGKTRPVGSYYAITGTVFNDGDQKMEDFTLHVAAPEGLHLLKTPQIGIFPERERPYLKKTQNPQQSVGEDEWSFSELRPDEYVELQYLVLSEKWQSAPQKLAIVAKEPEGKMYEVSYQEEIQTVEKESAWFGFLNKNVTEFTGRDIVALVFLPFFILVYVAMLALFVTTRNQAQQRQREKLEHEVMARLAIRR